MVNKLKINRKKILNILGSVFIFLSIVGLFLTFWPVAKEEVVYQSRVVTKKIKKNQEEKSLTPPNTSFSIVIPKIRAVAPVIASVDPNNKNEYLSVLKRGVAHAKGTSFPGQGGNTYIFAHSTDAFYHVNQYNAVFYLIGKLKRDDEIDIYYQDNKYVYKVDKVKVVSPSEVKYLGNLGSHDTLTLQTCYPPGTTLKRLVVTAKLVGID